MEPDRETWGFRPLELQLAGVFAVLSGIGWAVITGANASPLGRLGFFVVGLPIGAVFGLRIADNYLDSGPTCRGFIHVTGYICAAVLLEGAASWGNATVDGLLAAAVFVPLVWLAGRNWLTKRGDRALALQQSALVLVGIGPLAAVRSTADVIAIAALVVLLAVASWMNLRSRRRRIATGEISAPEPRPPVTGWRLWLRVVGVAVLSASSLGLFFGSVEADAVRCGSLTEALDRGEETDCAAEARIHAFGGFVCGVAAGALAVRIVRGRWGQLARMSSG